MGQIPRNTIPDTFSDPQRAREYSPSLGRFMQRDPLGYPDGMNTYAAYHVLHGGVDPSGMETEVGREPDVEPLPGGVYEGSPGGCPTDNWTDYDQVREDMRQEMLRRVKELREERDRALAELDKEYEEGYERRVQEIRNKYDKKYRALDKKHMDIEKSLDRQVQTKNRIANDNYEAEIRDRHLKLIGTREENRKIGERLQKTKTDITNWYRDELRSNSSEFAKGVSELQEQRKNEIDSLSRDHRLRKNEIWWDYEIHIIRTRMDLQDQYKWADFEEQCQETGLHY